MDSQPLDSSGRPYLVKWFLDPRATHRPYRVEVVAPNAERKDEVIVIMGAETARSISSQTIVADDETTIAPSTTG